MADNSLSKKSWKRIFTQKSKTQDSSPKYGAVPSATSSQANALSLSKQASSSTRTTTPAHSDTTMCTTLNNSAKAAGEIPQRATGNQAADIIVDLATDGCLWDRAYNILKSKEDKESNPIASYEDLLSRVLIRAQMKAPPASNETEDVSEVTNQIPQHNTITRREKLKEIAELGLKHMENKKVSKTILGHEIVLQDVVSNIAGAVKWTEDYIKDAIKDLPYASIIMAGVSLVLPLLKNPTDVEAANQDGLTYVTSQIRYYAAMESLLLPEDMKLDLKADLTDRLVDLYKLIIDFQVRSIIRFYRSRTKNFLRGTINYDGWDQKLQDIKDGDKELVLKFEMVMASTNLGLVSRNLQELKNLAQEAEASRKALNDLLVKVQEHVEVSRDQLAVLKVIKQHLSDPQTQNCLQDLRTTDPRYDKKRIEQTKGGLLENSYRWIMSNADFLRWRHGESTLLYIKGDPGKGKTMLLCGIIDEMSPLTKLTDKEATVLLSYFFCQATDSRINNGTAVLRGLIYLLLDQQPLLISHVREKYDHAGEKLFKDINAWATLSDIFFNILRDPSLQNTYLVVDALDECVTDLPLLLALIFQTSFSSRVKWILSSRNRTDIERELRLDESRARLSLELKENAEQVSCAVNTYIDYCISELAEIQYKLSLQDQVRNILRRKSDGTFLWVALVVQELKKAESWEVLDVINEVPAGLEELYRQMIGQIQRLDRRKPKLCRGVLSAATAAYRPLHLAELGVLSGLPPDISSSYESITTIVNMCGSFLTIRENIVYTIHQSAQDFLSADTYIFPSGIEDLYYKIFSRSLQVMSRTLRRDIYGLGAPGVSIDQVKQPDPDPLAAAQYSCLYWIDHLLDCDTRANTDSDLKDDGSVNKFLCQNYLYWLEALSLMRSLSSGVVMIRKLENWLRADKFPDLYALIHDAKRFVLYNRSVIEQAPLQIYCSALVFAPKKSTIRKRFEKDIPPWIQTKSKVQADWSGALQTLEGHSDWVSSVAFSPDGKQVVSGSGDRTVRLWDVAIGAALQTLEGHSGSVLSVAFSPDGKQVVSGSGGHRVRLWDVATGAALQTLEGHSGSVSSVAFSPDGKQVVSGSDDSTVRLWDVATGAALQTLEGHSNWVTSVAFSPDGKQVVSGSGDRTVRLWDVATGAALQTLEGHSDRITSVAFSPDGKQVVSGSDDSTVRLWDVATGAALQTLEGHSNWVTSVAFSPDGKQVVSGSGDRTVRLWDVATGAALQTLEGHSDRITSVALSPDGKQVVSGSGGSTVRLWDVATGAALQTLEGHSNWVTSVAFSPDGKQVVSGSGDRTVRLWDVAIGAALQTLEDHSGSVLSVALSPDGKQVVSGSGGHRVRLWDVATGAALQTLEGHSNWVTSVAFSPDGKQVVSGSGDRTVRLWDVAIGAALQTLEGHSDRITSVAFSPDGKQVVSGSGDNTVRLWDVATGAALQTLEGHSGSVSSVAFSPDGKQVVSGSGDRTVRLWDVATGAALQTLEGHSGSVLSVAFSPDGKQVVSGSYDHRVRLWDVATGAALQTLEGHSGSVSSVAFSPDGNITHSLSVLNNWVTDGRINVLWLPPDYRPTCTAAWNRIIVLGHTSGRISFFEFKEGLKRIL